MSVCWLEENVNVSAKSGIIDYDKYNLSFIYIM